MASCGSSQMWVSSAGWHPDTGHRLWRSTFKHPNGEQNFTFSLSPEWSACDALVEAMRLAMDRGILTAEKLWAD